MRVNPSGTPRAHGTNHEATPTSCPLTTNGLPWSQSQTPRPFAANAHILSLVIKDQKSLRCRLRHSSFVIIFTWRNCNCKGHASESESPGDFYHRKLIKKKTIFMDYHRDSMCICNGKRQVDRKFCHAILTFCSHSSIRTANWIIFTAILLCRVNFVWLTYGVDSTSAVWQPWYWHATVKLLWKCCQGLLERITSFQLLVICSRSIICSCVHLNQSPSGDRSLSASDELLSEWDRLNLNIEFDCCICLY